MTITKRAVGAAATGNNASVTPGAPAGVTAGDFVVIFAAIRNNGVGSVNTPTGWSAIVTNQNTVLLGRYWQTGDAMPLVTFTGGVANADTYARAVAWVGVAGDMLTEAVGDTAGNVSQQNINTAACAPAGDGHAVMLAVWKADDATSLATPAGFTADGLTNMTAGDDMLAALFSQIQTTDTDIAAGTVTVTGGVAAIGRSLTLAIRPAPVISVQAFSLFPPRTQITVTGLTPGDDVLLYRLVLGDRQLIRGGTLVGATDPSFVVVDGELPFGVPVAYEAVVNTAGIYTTGETTYALPGNKPILSDAITGDASQFVIVAWDEKAYDLRASVFKVGGRNVVVSGEVGMFEGSIEIFFEAYSSTEQFRELLRSATENVLQLRRHDPAYDGVDAYVSVLNARERRYSQDGTDGRRTWVLDVAETESWSEGLTSSAFTLQDLADRYAGLTLADLAGDFATLLAVAQADLSP